MGATFEDIQVLESGFTEEQWTLYEAALAELLMKPTGEAPRMRDFIHADVKTRLRAMRRVLHP